MIKATFTNSAGREFCDPEIYPNVRLVSDGELDFIVLTYGEFLADDRITITTATGGWIHLEYI